MSLEALKKILPSSITPQETDRIGDWSQVEKTLRISLPADYKDYISAYGSAMIEGPHLVYILPYNPFSKQRHRNLLQQLDFELKILREIRSYRSDFVFPIYPEPCGLLPWGSSGDGHSFYWQMIGEPANWTVVVMGPRRGPIEQFAESMTNFLTKFISGTLESELFSNYEPDEDSDELDPLL